MSKTCDIKRGENFPVANYAMLCIEVTSYDHKLDFIAMMLLRVLVKNIKVESTLRSVSLGSLNLASN